MMLRYAEYASVFFIHRTKHCQTHSVKTVRINCIKNVFKTGLNPPIKVSVLYAKQITFNKFKNHEFYNGKRSWEFDIKLSQKCLRFFWKFWKWSLN